jgi:hypothetical protein
MKLREMITLLEGIKDKNMVVEKGFDSPHSWRGDYYDLAFEPCENVTIQSMLDCAKSAVGQTYEGYKGDDFTMDEDTEIHISNYGTSNDYLGEYFIYYLTKNLNL